MYGKNRSRQIHFKCSYNKSYYFPGLYNVLPKGNNASEEAMT